MRKQTWRAAVSAAAICVAPAAFAEQPDAFVEYVESTSAGKQYIDTGVIGKCGTKAEMKLLWSATGDTTFLGTLAASGGDTRFILCAKSGKSPANAISGGHRIYTKGAVIYSSETPDHIVSSITNDGASVSISIVANGNTSVDVTREEDALDTGRTMYMFARHEANDSAGYHAVTRCYSTKIWQLDGDGNWELKRDYRPCVKGEKAGLYDTVSGEIFYSLGTSDFVAGPDIRLHAEPDHFIQYVESTGSQYIDTGIIGRCGTGADMAILWIGGPDSSFLSSRVDDGDTRFILCSNQGGYKHYYMAHRSYVRNRDISTYTYSATTPEHIVSSITHDGTNVKYTMSVNGKQEINVEREEAALDTNISMYLFAQNKGGAADLKSSVRCFGVKITQDGTLVRDFRPCLKDGRAGLYDEVSGWIFFPQGGELVYPNETPDKYVKWAKAPGSSFVPVAVRAKSGVRAEMKFRPMGTGEDQYFLAARNSLNTDTRFLLNYVYRKTASNNCITIGYRDRWHWRRWLNWAVNTDYTLSSEIANDGSVNGTLAGTYTTAETNVGTQSPFDTGLDLYMFAANMGGDAQGFYTGRFYYTTIDVYDETAEGYVPVRDFKPCVKDGYVMFYDNVSKTMFKPYPAIPAEGNVNKNGFILVVR